MSAMTRQIGVGRAARSVRAASLALLACSVPLSAKSAPPPDAMPVRSLMQLRNDSLVRQHWDLSCGAAVVATLLTYQLGTPTTEREAALGMLREGDARLVRARLGFSLLDLKRFAASRGFEAAGFGGLTLDELVAMAPAVAPIRVFGFAHFVVVRGRVGDRLLLADPAFGNRTMKVETFLDAWPSRVGFIIYPPGQPHPPNRMGTPRELFLAPTTDVVRTAQAGQQSLGGGR
jgi:predicted double-glycine peptidase